VDPSVVLRPAEGVVWVGIADELVVYRAVRPDSFVLNTVAGLLWQCLDGSSPLADIFDDLADAFGTERSNVETDCVPVVRTWLAHRLVEEVSGA
jgi:hypothetical protein